MAPERRRTKEELDQEWSELVEEHRLAMPGVQVLFAFLLILPFQQRFSDLTEGQTYVYYSALLCAAVAIVLALPLLLAEGAGVAALARLLVRNPVLNEEMW